MYWKKITNPLLLTRLTAAARLLPRPAMRTRRDEVRKAKDDDEDDDEDDAACTFHSPTIHSHSQRQRGKAAVQQGEQKEQDKRREQQRNGMQTQFAPGLTKQRKQYFFVCSTVQ